MWIEHTKCEDLNETIDRVLADTQLREGREAGVRYFRCRNYNLPFGLEELRNCRAEGISVKGVARRRIQRRTV